MSKGLRSEVNTKFERLTKDFVNLKIDHLSSSDRSKEVVVQSKVIVFANTVTSGEEMFSYLERFVAEQWDISWLRERPHKQSSATPEEKRERSARL